MRPSHPDRVDNPEWGLVAPGESRLPASASVVGIMLLQLLLPTRLILGPWWLIPAIEGAVLLSLLIVGPTQLNAEAKEVRIIALGLVGILIAADGSTLGLLIDHLLRQGDSTEGRTLIYSGAAVWFTAVVAFGLLFWEIDRGGPIRRCRTDHFEPDFLFPQMGSPGSTAKPWTPRFIDYLYLSLTNSTAFSPTDVLPMTLRAKVFMAVQSLASLGTIVIVGARAVNILT